MKHNFLIGVSLITVFSFLLPTEIFAKMLPVPYTSQAPYANWAEPWQNACEEASILMVDKFYSKPGNYRIKAATAKKQLLEIFKIKNRYFKASLDENAQKIVDMVDKFYKWEAVIIKDPTLEMIKEEIDNERPVILPLYGKALKNKYFKNGGPDYHVLVISGYDDDTKEFITEEPGLNTLGIDFRYKYATIMSAIHDFNGKGKTKNGARVAIFTSPELNKVIF